MKTSIDSLPYPRGDSDHILLYIDNSKYTFDSILAVIKKMQGKSEENKVKAVKHYVLKKAVADLRIVKEPVAAEELANAIITMQELLDKKEQEMYWMSVMQHYENKYQESL